MSKRHGDVQVMDFVVRQKPFIQFQISTLLTFILLETRLGTGGPPQLAHPFRMGRWSQLSSTFWRFETAIAKWCPR